VTKAPAAARVIAAEQIRAVIGFPDLVEPVSRAFQASTAGKAANGLIVMFPALDPKEGDVYVKTGTLAGHSIYIVKVSPWFRANLDSGQPQGGFIAVCDAETGHTLAILDDQHYLSDIRTAAAGAVAARPARRRDHGRAAGRGCGARRRRRHHRNLGPRANTSRRLASARAAHHRRRRRRSDEVRAGRSCPDPVASIRG
jgi:ornithine cyclodeaminase/alanine dehydrogenase-like protein (mu-crystallin family)